MMPMNGFIGTCIASEKSATSLPLSRARANQVTRPLRNRRAARRLPWRPGSSSRKHAAGRAGAVHAVRHARPERENLHFEHVARLGSVDVDRAGEHVTSAATRLAKRAARRPEVEHILQDLVALHAVAGQKLGRGSSCVDPACDSVSMRTVCPDFTVATGDLSIGNAPQVRFCGRDGDVDVGLHFLGEPDAEHAARRRLKAV